MAVHYGCGDAICLSKFGRTTGSFKDITCIKCLRRLRSNKERDLHRIAEDLITLSGVAERLDKP